jgi:hypothetical protein
MDTERYTRADTEQETTTRRRLLGSVAAAGVTLAGAAGASTRTATAQATTEGADVTAPLVVPADAPTLGNDDFTGLLLQVVDQGTTDASDTDVASCDALDADRVISYRLELTDERDDTEELVEATGFAARSNDTVRPDREFVVSGQESCVDDYRRLSLEEVTRSSVDVDTETTSTPVPGFGAGTALAGVAATVAGAAWRAVRS